MKVLLYNRLYNSVVAMHDIDFITERKIIKIGSLLNNVRDEYLCKKNITSAQSETLLFYFGNQGKSITDLKNHLQVSHQAARKLVDKLREKEYLYLTFSKKDARVTEVFLTDKGLEICTRLIHEGSHAGAALLQNFSKAEKEKLLSFLMQIEENIKN